MPSPRGSAGEVRWHAFAEARCRLRSCLSCCYNPTLPGRGCNGMWCGGRVARCPAALPSSWPGGRWPPSTYPDGLGFAATPCLARDSGGAWGQAYK
eukprot:13873916-Alexandrium_andersonii.AAC.1